MALFEYYADSILFVSNSVVIADELFVFSKSLYFIYFCRNVILFEGKKNRTIH